MNGILSSEKAPYNCKTFCGVAGDGLYAAIVDPMSTSLKKLQNTPVASEQAEATED